MVTPYMDFGTGVFHVDGDAPLTQDQVNSVWRHLPTTGASWVERGRLYVQQFDGATAFNLGPVERGVKGVSAEVRRNHATKRKAGLSRGTAEGTRRAWAFLEGEPFSVMVKKGQAPVEAVVRSLKKRLGADVTLWPLETTPSGTAYRAQWLDPKSDQFREKRVEIWRL